MNRIKVNAKLELHALLSVAPHAVHVSSDFESMPGIKDAERMRRFVAAVRRADNEQ